MEDILDMDIENEKVGFLDKAIDWIMCADPVKVYAYVDKLREQNPNIDDDALAKKIVSRKSIKSGFVGFASGIPGLLTLPVTISSDLAITWKIQAYMACSIAYVYGHTSETTDLKTDIYIIMAGDAAKEALKRVGIEVSKEVTKRAINKYITREVMKKIWAIMGRKIITKAGEKSLLSFMRMAPLVGAPVGYVFDWGATRIVGRTAIKYYSG